MTVATTTLDACFFASSDNTPLFGVWRAPDETPRAVCVVAPPFGEEEKSSRRVLTTILEAWRERGVASLLPSLRGTGDSQGDFATVSLEAWRDDLRAACEEARRRAPDVPLWLLGVRLGGALALPIANEVGARSLTLLEPVLDGKRYVSQIEAKHRLRANLTQHEGGTNGSQSAASQSGALDLDGWPLSQTLREELRALNASTLDFKGDITLVQVGPRAELTPPLRDFAERLKTRTHAVVMPAFWNANDELDAAELVEVLSDATVGPPPAPPGGRGDGKPNVSPASPLPPGGAGGGFALERPFLFQSASQTLVGVHHHADEPRDLTVVLLHGWSGYRVGPHQMLTRTARAFAASGLETVRFDFAGRGDSQGVTSHATLATMRDDTRALLKLLRENGARRFALVGLCAGCEIAFACADEPNVVALGLWSAPVFAAAESGERVSKRRAHFAKVYARKLLRPETWRKLLSGRVDARGVGKALGGTNAGEARNAEADALGQLPRGWKAARLDAFARAAPALRALLIYGTSDPVAGEAEAWYRQTCEAARMTPQLHHVEGANHSYYGLNWEAEVIAQTRDWLHTLA